MTRQFSAHPGPTNTTTTTADVERTERLERVERTERVVHRLFGWGRATDPRPESVRQ